ncbi:MAG: GIY-YIG nuclease family protein [Candidatus Diapherotrites archaeon]
MKGIYILLIKICRTSRARIGSLGIINLKKGLYTYVGSAQNSLEKRIARHYSKNKKLHWHIDYILSLKSAKIIRVFYKKAGKRGECRIARKISRICIPVLGIGCSDCKCNSHFCMVGNQKTLLKLAGCENFKCYTSTPKKRIEGLKIVQSLQTN